jgi:hypothetical protein
MKKVLASVAIATGMVLMSATVASAATTAPTIKVKKTISKSAEGTATHEMSETSNTQKTEAKKKPVVKTAAVKKPVVKKK